MLRIAIAAMAICCLAETTAFACSCAGVKAKTTFKSSTAVFLGEIIATEPDGPTTFRVHESFKGPASSVLRVNGCAAGMCSYACHGDTSVGTLHVIYAYGSREQLKTSMCNRNMNAHHPLSDLSILRHRAAWWRSPISSLRVIVLSQRVLRAIRR